MNGRKGLIGIIIALMFLSAAYSAVASGKNEAGQPEPVEVKSEAPASAAQPANANAYPPEGWVTDIREAYKIARKEDKRILIDFTGSDWCVWCKKLSAEVFTTPEFKKYADENLVLLYLDFPNSLELPADQVRHNQIIAQILGIQGYPSIWLMNGDFTPLLVTGYREGGAEEYIRHLENDRPDVSAEEAENFRLAFTDAIVANIGSLD